MSFTFIQTSLPNRTLVAPFDGVITEWRVRVQATNSGYGFQLEVLKDNGSGVFSRERQSSVELPSLPFGGSTQIFPARIPIAAGEQTALTYFQNSVPTALSAVRTNAGQLGIWCPAFTGGPAVPTYTQGGELLLSARVEPDADDDGFGDETQDLCPTDASLQEACPPDPPPPDPPATADRTPPETAITSGPASLRSRKKRVAARFAFESSELATWECRLDGGGWRPCASPYEAVVRTSKRRKTHRFEVRATDLVGNVEPSAASRAFTVKRRP